MRLGEVVELKRGFDLPAQRRDPGPVPVVSSSGPSGFHARAMVKAPGVVTGRYGTLGQVFFITEDFWPLNTTLYVCDFKGNDPLFVSYLLRTIDFDSCSDKAAVPGVNRNHLHELTVSIPELNEQRAVAHILGALDDKIDLNRRMNETLEELARTIFKSWFVDFDPVRAKTEGKQPFGMDGETAALFPSRFVDSESGHIPEGWQLQELRHRTSAIQYGLTASANSQAIGPKFLRITDISGGTVNWTTVPFCAIAEGEIAKYAIKHGDIFVARTGASTGENIFVVEPPRAVFASYLVRFQFSSLAEARLVAAFMRSEGYKRHVAGCLGGSAQPNASAQMLAAARMVFPSPILQEAFYSVVQPLDAKRAGNDRESATLTELRDLLLPKLISGELRVRDAEKLAEAAL